MKSRRGIHLLWGLLALMLVWGLFSWPLPRFITRGIPSTGRTTETPTHRYMVSGDHLQLLYHLWLGSDMLAGQTPWFHNLYEFNTGDDAQRREVSPYYAPFCLTYAVGYLIAGHPFGWNLTGWLSLAFTLWFTCLLVARYVRDPWMVLAASLVSIALPYRWMALLGGSPAGLGMMWVPLYYYALERMVCDRKMLGGLVAGMALVLSEWVDTHVFFFCALSTPFWCLFAYWYHARRWFPAAKAMAPHFKACIPFLALLGFVGIQVSGISSGLEGTHTGETGRSLREVAIYSPVASGILSWRDIGPSSDIYIGWFAIALLGIGVILFFAQALKDRTRGEFPRGVAFLLLMAAVYVMAMLALGVNNPGGERAWRLLTRVVPPYSMIRQTSRVYTLLPTVLAVALAILFANTYKLVKRPWVPLGLCILTLVWLAADYAHRIRPGLCLLDDEQLAYASVHDDAEEYQIPARAMAIPLWPGDSHWSSLYEYYATLYRTRMVNGYRPSVRKAYFDDVYLRYESCNKGQFTDDQLDHLKKRGIQYLLLHENAFPEKVSPFAVSHTLQAMLRHPRLTALTNSLGVWAFRIEEAPVETGNWMPDWTYSCPSRLWQAERSDWTNAIVLEADDASGNKYVRMSQPGAVIETSPYPMYSLTKLHFLARLKGHGRLRAAIWPGASNEVADIWEIDSDQWTWKKLSLPAFDGYRGLPVRYRLEDGHVDVDVIMLPVDDWYGEFDELLLPAPVFFHAGYTDPATGQVVLSPERDPADAIFYGPKAPLPVGAYRVQMDFESDAPEGVLLGYLQNRYAPDLETRVPVYVGQSAEMLYEQPDNRRMAVDFVYSRNAPMRISSVRISSLREHP
ncbi:MAG: hypothetical protein EOM20_12625 [Spartobacteria bacterium]|nr:hypothetical protein [Spartobacteria bacterium]